MKPTRSSKPTWDRRMYIRLLYTSGPSAFALPDTSAACFYRPNRPRYVMGARQRSGAPWPPAHWRCLAQRPELRNPAGQSLYPAAHVWCASLIATASLWRACHIHPPARPRLHTKRPLLLGVPCLGALSCRLYVLVGFDSAGLHLLCHVRVQLCQGR
jgi:hypothetical protein